MTSKELGDLRLIRTLSKISTYQLNCERHSISNLYEELIQIQGLLNNIDDQRTLVIERVRSVKKGTTLCPTEHQGYLSLLFNHENTIDSYRSKIEEINSKISNKLELEKKIRGKSDFFEQKSVELKSFIDSALQKKLDQDSSELFVSEQWRGDQC